jgi:Uma2 family endonuclease
MSIPLSREIVYPESDGKPMGETELHRQEITYGIEALAHRFREAADVYVNGDMFFYFEEGNPRAVVCPDVMVVPGTSKVVRRIWQTWKEGGRVPSFVVEVTSRDTRSEDLGKKKDLYERLGVEEYFLYDPLEEYLSPRLRGFRRAGERFQPVRHRRDGFLESQTTGVTFRPEGDRLRLYETATGKPLLRADEALVRLEAAEEELARLRAELERR